MRDIPLPIYDDPVERYVVPADHDAEVRRIIRAARLVAVDTETYYNPLIRGVTRFIDDSPNNCPFCLTMTYSTEDGELRSIYIDEEHIPEYAPVLLDTTIAKVLHNSKYDMHILSNIGIELRGEIWDTMIMIHLIDEEHMCRTPDGGFVESKALKNLAYHYLGDNGHKYEELVDETRRVLALRRDCIKSKISYKDAGDACPLIMKDYACSDTEFTYQLYHIFREELIRQELLKAYDVDMKATLAVFRTERHGIKVDLEYYKRLDEELKQEMSVCTSLILTLIPKELNINSANDLVQGFKELGLEWRWYTAKQELKTSDEILTGIIRNGTAAQQLLASAVLQYREADKLSGTFIAQVFKYVQWDGRIHPDFNVCPRDDRKNRTEGGTVTGRLSSSNPNLQNIPKDDKRIRKGIVPDDDYILVEFDYAQQEYRLLAHYAQDRNFMQIIHDGKDIHIGTAERLLHLDFEQAKLKHNRDRGKKLNFSIVYGLGLAALAKSLGLKIDETLYKKAGMLLREWEYKPWDMPSYEAVLSRCTTEEEVGLVTYYFSDEARSAIAQAEQIKADYFEQFPQIKDFIKNCSKLAKQRGWVKTWTGRRRHFKRPKEEGYKGPNAVIQGGCGDITKTRMWLVDLFLADKRSRCINNIHDALLFEIHKSELHILPALKRILKDLDFSVPMDVDAEMSDTSWGNMKKVEIDDAA